ncbi:unnamed protein product, partial [Coregonus sp. 'balchen']
ALRGSREGLTRGPAPNPTREQGCWDQGTPDPGTCPNPTRDTGSSVGLKVKPDPGPLQTLTPGTQELAGTKGNPLTRPSPPNPNPDQGSAGTKRKPCPGLLLPLPRDQDPLGLKVSPDPGPAPNPNPNPETQELCWDSRDTGALLGLKVVGGKMMDSGRLCAFITKVKRGSLADTVGHLRPGDQVLEWNGRVLQGATFKEVYNVILESKPDPQVELVVSRPIG